MLKYNNETLMSRKQIVNTTLNRKEFNPSGIRRNSTGQAGQAKEYENNTPLG